MRSLVVTGPGGLEWQEVDAPRLSAQGDALVRPVASSACDLDRGIVAGRSPFAPPFPLGHEAVGEIVELADDDGDLAIGDLVVIPWHVSCGRCESCRRRLPGACASVPPLASYGTTAGGRWGGLFDDVVRVPWAAGNLTPLPASIDPFLAAPVADNLTDAFQAVRPTLEACPEGDVLVVGGTASLGLLVVLSAAALKAPTVTYVDVDPDRRAKAASLGAQVVAVDAYPERLDAVFDLVVDASAAIPGLHCALRSTRPGGTCVVRSVYFKDPPLPYFEMYARGVTLITGPPPASSYAADVLALIGDGRLDPSPALVGPLDYEEAVEVLLDPPAAKPVFLRSDP